MVPGSARSSDADNLSVASKGDDVLSDGSLCRTESNRERKIRKISEYLQLLWSSDWTKACVVGPLLCLVPLLIVLLGLLFLYIPQRRADRLRRVIDNVLAWDMASVLSKVCVLCELFFILQVGFAKITYICLSWSIELLANKPIADKCGLVFVVGLIMFLLPPVPGVPVYVFAGILIAAEADSSADLDFGSALIIAVVVSVWTKLVALLGQYGIGYFMGKSVEIQKLVGVDTIPTRAIEKILSGRCSLSQVIIIIGGPDWPTGVTCGILRMNVPKMLLCALPIVIICSPCVAAGAFLARDSGEDRSWTIYSFRAVLLAGIINILSFLAAVVVVGWVIDEHQEELSAYREEHNAVMELRRADEEFHKMYVAATAWTKLSLSRKCLIGVPAFAMTYICFVFLFLDEFCFRPFALTSRINDSYDAGGLEGKPLSIVRFPLGVVAVSIFVVASLLHSAHVEFSKFFAQQESVLPWWANKRRTFTE